MPSTHVTRELYYSADQMFSLVADVERYPEFVPNWQTVRVRDRQDNSYCTDQVVRLGPMRHTFSTHTTLEPPRRILVSSNDPPFRNFELLWTFEPAEDDGCRISLTADFDLRSRALQAIGSILSRDSVVRMVNAFETRAHSIYGAPTHASHV